MTVVLDTNALMMPVECDVRLFEELDRILGDGKRLVPAAVVAELDRLAEGAGEEGVAASVGQDLVDRCTVCEHDASDADDAVLELARQRESYAVTNDGPLRDRLLAAGVPVIRLRGRNKLAVTQP